MKIFLTIILGLYGFSTLIAQPCTIRFRGHVHSSETHENLAGATIRLNSGQTLTTNANGDFVFDSLCAGEYTIIISHSHYQTIEQALILDRNIHLDFDLNFTSVELSEVTVTGLRQISSTGLRKEISGDQLDAAKSLSLAQALSRLSGVALLQTGSTISKPVIHGLHSARIVTINNGVRQEGQQWGNEHAPEIDPYIAGKLSVIKGVDELRYGSDAIGGVVLIEPRKLRNTPGQHAEINAALHSNNKQYAVSGIFEQQLKSLPKLTYRLQGTFKKAANIHTPAYRLNNTALREINFSGTASWKKEHFETEVFYSRFQNETGIFAGTHIGNLTDLEKAIRADRPDATFTGQDSYSIGRPKQHVVHDLLKSKTHFDIGNHKFNLLLSGQSNYRQEYDVLRNLTSQHAQLNLRVYTFSQELTWEHPSIGNFRGLAGLAATQQDNSYSGRYLIPNYTSNAYGGYFIEKWNKKQWNAEAGIRYDLKEINTSRLQAASQTFSSYHFEFGTIAASGNLGYRFAPGWKSNLMASMSTRAPQVNELLTNGVHHGTGTYEVGNIDLDPEESFHIALTNIYENPGKTFYSELTLYRNSINHFIYQQPMPDEPVLTIRGAFPRMAYESTNALLSGLDFSAQWDLNSHLSAGIKYALLRAKDRKLDDWLIMMPADRLSGEIIVGMKDKGRFIRNQASMEVQHVFKQTKVPSGYLGQHDYKLPPAAYTLLHAEISTTLKHEKWPATISIAGRNLLNTAYRDYLNSFRYFTDEMGRNIMVRIKLNLNN